MSPRQIEEDILAMEQCDPDRPYGFPRMRCNPEVRAIAANERAMELGGTPQNIAMTVIRELSECAK